MNVSVHWHWIAEPPRERRAFLGGVCLLFRVETVLTRCLSFEFRCRTAYREFACCVDSLHALESHFVSFVSLFFALFATLFSLSAGAHCTCPPPPCLVRTHMSSITCGETFSRPTPDTISVYHPHLLQCIFIDWSCLTSKSEPVEASHVLCSSL